MKVSTFSNPTLNYDGQVHPRRSDVNTGFVRSERQINKERENRKKKLYHLNAPKGVFIVLVFTPAHGALGPAY